MKRVLITALLIGALAGLNAFPGQGKSSERRIGCENLEENSHCENIDKFHKRHFMGMMKEELELTDEQQNKFENDRMEFEKFRIQKDSEIKILHLDQRNYRKKQDFSEMRKITNKLFEIKKLIALEKIEMHEKHWNMLTDDQKAKVKEFMNDHPRMGKRMNRKAKHLKK